MLPPYIIVAMPRCGFHLLRSLVESTGTAPKFVELNEFIKMESTDANILAYSQYNYDKHNKNGNWGLKLDKGNLLEVLRLIELQGWDIQKLKYVYLTRRNMIHQAISHCISQQTHRYWLPVDASDKEKEMNAENVEVNDEMIADEVQSFWRWNHLIELFFRHNQIEPYRIQYEDFMDTADWHEAVSRIMAYFGFPMKSDICLSPGYLKQRNEERVRAREIEFLRKAFPMSIDALFKI